jgi:hypothetical protein
MANPYALDGEWFKGNLHVHTTESDGKLSPQEVVAAYAGHGYDFLSITDHRKVTDVAALDSMGMLLLPGMEMDGGKTQVDGSYHIVAIGGQPGLAPEQSWSAQELIDYGVEHCEFVFMAHPAWLSQNINDFTSLDGFLGMEVYNTTCHHGIGRGHSEVHWDDLLATGRRAFGFAVDDAHWGYDDAFAGYIMVRAEMCEHAAIIDAIKAGHFYASNGPTIEYLERDGEKLYVRCSPCFEIRTICPLPGRGMTTYRTDYKPPFTEVEFTIADGTDPVRVECINEVGDKAWSNPIWL